jgi:hypothetical protein
MLRQGGKGDGLAELRMRASRILMQSLQLPCWLTCVGCLTVADQACQCVSLVALARMLFTDRGHGVPPLGCEDGGVTQTDQGYCEGGLHT